MTCLEPSSRLITSSAPVTPAPALSWSLESTVNGGQFVAQSPLQVLFPAVSLLKVYSVLPSSPVRNLPIEAEATLTS